MSKTLPGRYHPSHILDGAVPFNCRCRACEHKAWGDPDDYNNDTELYHPCKPTPEYKKLMRSKP